jgi:hydrogenase-4 component B
MDLIRAFIAAVVAGLVLIPFFKGRGQRMAVFLFLLLIAVISAVPAWQGLMGKTIEWSFQGNLVTGPVPFRLDALSAWFILIISFIFLTGIFYGFFYLKPYSGQRQNLTLHYISFLLLYASLISLCVIRNSLVFLVAWEIMTLSAFMVVIFEHEKQDTIKAGLNFLIQSHVSVLFLVTGFIWASIKTGSYDFNALSAYTASHRDAVTLALMICLIIGFAIKAGFVPFHTWLPYAHPAAPAHISGIMSGVIIKIGIYGILRMLLTLQTDYTTVGYIILAISAISGLYGVMLAIVQHNLKKLLAYHSVENIGIIGIGIGIGSIGLGTNNNLLVLLGFAGALLHTLNHALYKSLLFYAAGTIYQATHTLNVEHLGGLIKKMPRTAILFLIAAIAICGIPPFNGFISEFILYTGLYQWLINTSLIPSITALLLILALVLIGGLALLCFTKAFGIVFLGTPRKEFHHDIQEPPFLQLLPLYLTGILIVGIGLFPQLFIRMLTAPVSLFSGAAGSSTPVIFTDISGIMQSISLAAWGLVVLTLVVYSIRSLAIKNHKSQFRNLHSEISNPKSQIRNPKSQFVPTWGCGYVGSSPKLQYTASSFVRTYRKLNAPLLLISQKKKEITTIFPDNAYYESHAGDKAEKWLIDKPVTVLRNFFARFLFLQNGRLQSYLLYGILYIMALIFLPVIFEKVATLFGFLKQL